VAVVGAPIAAFALLPYLSRATRFALALAIGLLVTLIGGLSDTLRFITAGPAWSELSGVGFTVGGLLLLLAAAAALAARPRRPRRTTRARRAARAAAWVVGALLVAQVLLIPFGTAVWTVHAPRLPVDEASLGIAHDEIRIPMPDGGKLAAWYVPSRNGAALLVVHGSSGNRERVADHARMLARHGYGVLALDLPGNGESDGRSNGMGSNAQPALTAAVGYLGRRGDVEDGRIGGLGLSLGAEVLLEAAARDERIRAVVADGAERDSDDVRLEHVGGAALRAQHWLTLQVVRGISGMHPPGPLVDLVARIAPRPVLLIATSSRSEIAVNRVYRSKAGPTATLWELPGAKHTRGLDSYPRAYERRVAGFLGRALAPGRSAAGGQP
jgi:pimeloyl-ACP methyl ester carboxylesterase